jgi:Leucine-rich repeat (LRR) protein
MNKYFLVGLLVVVAGGAGLWFVSVKEKGSVAGFDFSVSNLEKSVSGSDDKKTVNLTHKNIQSLPDNLSSNLKPVVDLKHYPVRIIDLSYNEISGVLKKGTFKDITKVTFIKLTNNKITSIEPHAFDSLPSLQWIYLSHNKIANFKADTFKHLTGVWGIVLDHNELTTLEDEVLDDLRLLHDISFAHNKITRLQSNMFADVRTEKDDAEGKVSNIESIDLSGNPITRVEDNALAELPNLKVIRISKDLSEDVIQTIKAQAHNANKTCEVVLV